MSITLLWQTWRSRIRHRRGAARLAVEELEGRLVPDAVTWMAGSGNWDVPTNWFDASTESKRVPTAGDDVVIPPFFSSDFTGPRTPTVTIDSDVGTIHSLSAGRNLTINGGALTISAASSVDAPAVLTISGGTLTLAGTGADGLLTVGLLSQSGGTLTGPGNLVVTNTYAWSGGVLGGPATATLTGSLLATAGDRTLDQRTLAIEVPSSWSGGTFTLGDGAQFVVGNTGQLDVSGPGQILSGPGGGSFTVNAGSSLLKDDPSVTDLAVPVSSAGFVDISNGTLQLDGDATLTDLTLNNGTLAADGHVTVTGTFFWAGGDLAGSGTVTLSPTADLEFGGATASLDGTLINATPTGVWLGGDISGAGRFINQAGSTVAVLGDGSFTASVDNRGTIITHNAGTLTLSDLTNSGTLVVQAGQLQLTGTFTQTGGTFELTGGTVQASLFDLQGGTLDGTGTLIGDVVNNATIDPQPVLYALPTISDHLSTGDGLSARLIAVPALLSGTPGAGVLTINGNYTQGTAGVLNMNIGGTQPGINQDQLAVSGTAALGGTMNITTLDGFVPSPGDSFTLMTAGAAAGNFATVNGLAGNGFTYTPNQSAISFFVSVLQPSSSSSPPAAAPVPPVSPGPVPVAAPLPVVGFSTSETSAAVSGLEESPAASSPPLPMSATALPFVEGLPFTGGEDVITGLDQLRKKAEPEMIAMLPREMLNRYFAEERLEDVTGFSGSGGDIAGPVADQDQPGTIRGQVFTDLDGDGMVSTGEPLREGQGVYLDLNRNGEYDEGEPYTFTNSAGDYIFRGLLPGTYSVRLDLTRRMDQTMPVEPAYTITLGPKHPGVMGVNFGVKDRRLLRPHGGETKAPGPRLFPWSAVCVYWVAAWDGRRRGQRRGDFMA